MNIKNSVMLNALRNFFSATLEEKEPCKTGFALTTPFYMVIFWVFRTE